MELNTRSRVMILNVVVLAGGLLLSVASYGAETEKPENWKRPDLPKKLSVTVPAAVRKDLVAQAVELCHAAFPKTPKEWFEKEYREYLDTPRWEVMHGAFGLASKGPRVKFRGKPDIILSFPRGRSIRSLLWQGEPPPGHVKREIGPAEALEAAQDILSRLGLRPAVRRKLKLTKKDLRWDRVYWFDWFAPVGPGHVDQHRVMMWVSKRTGAVVLCRVVLRERPAEPRTPFARERIEKKLATLDRGFRRERLGLSVNYTVGGPGLCWEYTSPRDARGLSRVIRWDATTGKRIWSNAYDAEGKRHRLGGPVGCWADPEAYPWRTKKQVVERLEKTAAERAKELTGKEPEEPAEDE